MNTNVNLHTPIMAVATILTLAAAATPGLTRTAEQAGRRSAPPRLTATVSASGRVSLTASNGGTVTRLHNGWYTVAINVDSRNADFHLSGPQVHRATRSHFTGVAIWGVHFLKGTYRYMSDRNARATTRTISVY